MKKKLVSIVLASLLVSSSFAVCAVDIDSMNIDELKTAYQELEEKYNKLLEEKETETETQSMEETSSDIDFEYSADGYTYKYLKNEVETINGEDYVHIYFDYTNGSEQSNTPFYSLFITAYQNGVELESGSVFETGVTEVDNTMKNVQSGTTLTVAYPYKLNDTSPVSIEIKPMISFGDVEIGKLEFDLNK